MKVFARGSETTVLEVDSLQIDVGDDGASIVLEDLEDKIAIRTHVRRSFWNTYAEHTEYPCRCSNWDAFACGGDRACECSCHWANRSNYPKQKRKP